MRYIFSVFLWYAIIIINSKAGRCKHLIVNKFRLGVFSSDPKFSLQWTLFFLHLYYACILLFVNNFNQMQQWIIVSVLDKIKNPCMYSLKQISDPGYYVLQFIIKLSSNILFWIIFPNALSIIKCPINSSSELDWKFLNSLWHLDKELSCSDGKTILLCLNYISFQYSNTNLKFASLILFLPGYARGLVPRSHSYI